MKALAFSFGASLTLGLAIWLALENYPHFWGQ